MGVALKVENLSFTYPKSDGPAVDGISFSLSEGQFLGLVGPNGAGKTTTMSIVAGLLPLAQGQLEFFGKSAADFDRRTAVAMAPQELAIYPMLSAWENLELFASLGKVAPSELKKRISDCLEFVGLAAQAQIRVHKYSGGMKRRLNLAAALVAEPRILLLDEPTVGVDPQSRSLILASLKKLSSKGTSIIYSSHYLEEVEKLCHELVLIDLGRTVFKGTVAAFKQGTGTAATLEDRFMQLTGPALRDN
jgi:ABC-2 type transport system ATP-binding protein